MAINPFDKRGGGQALPPFLQGRTAMMPGFGPPKFGSRPMITPKATVAPGEVKPTGPVGVGGGIPQPSPMAPKSAVTPPKSSAQTLFDYFKQDLESERNRALAGARADASARGVFYGTPLTTSEGDINTSFLKGLGSLQAGILGNEQQNELARLSLASQMAGRGPSFEQLAGMGQFDPSIFQTIGSLFAPRPGPTGPRITPAPTQQPLTRKNFRR